MNKDNKDQQETKFVEVNSGDYQSNDTFEQTMRKLMLNITLQEIQAEVNSVSTDVWTNVKK